MCGFVGIIGEKPNPDLLRNITRVLAHRGPDGEGFFLDDFVQLGHRRLSIIDVEGGKQPLFNEDESIVCVCNGEIYNFKQLRSNLEAKGHHFKTKSDSEVLIHLYEEYGVDFVPHLDGMFAFAIWDKKEQNLILGRDRLGIKPLYYISVKDSLFFSSEVRPLLSIKKLRDQLRISPNGLYSYLQLRYTPHPQSIIEGISKLSPGYILFKKKGEPEKIKEYWDIRNNSDCLEACKGKSNVYDPKKIFEKFDQLCQDSAHSHLMSDVPLGLMLSSGMDSNLLLYYMSEKLDKVETFTMGFDFADNELDLTRNIANVFNTKHHEFFIRKEHIDSLEDSVKAMDTPIGDFNTTAWFIFCKFIKQNVKVVLSGQGVDELFAGYLHHMFFHRVASAFNIFKSESPFKFLGKQLKRCPRSLINKFFNHPASFGEREKERLVNFLESFSLKSDAYLSLVSVFNNNDISKLCQDDYYQGMLDDQNTYKGNSLELFTDNPSDFLNNMLTFEQKYWLPDFILEFTDRVSMAAGLEVRVPYLDHRLVEFIRAMPVKYKINIMNNKIFIKKLARAKLEKLIGVRKKLGFYVPVDKWDQKVIKGLVSKYLDRDMVREQGIFRYEHIQKLLDDFSHSPMLVTKQLFNIAIFTVWNNSVFNNIKLYD